MPKINKDTLKTLKNGVKVFKYENKNSYNCYFQVGSTYAKSGKKYYGLGTKNINDATIRANTKYKEWHTTNAEKSKKFLDFDLDVAQPYLRYKIRKYRNKTNIKDNEQGSRDKAKWENFLKPYFEDVNYHDTDEVERIIDDEVLSDLKEQGKSGNTINKYMSVLTQMYKRAKDRGTVNVIPDTPTQEVINTPRIAYENLELNLINRQCDELANTKKDIFFLDCKDYFNVCRSAGFRPGLEVLNLKRKDYKFLTDSKDPNYKVLEYTIWGTKTKPIHKPVANSFFTEKIFPEIINRHIGAELKDDDYLLFPFLKDRKRLKNKAGKLFVDISKKLQLFYKDGGTRPLYSVRHTYATELYKKGAKIDDIATLMNTSPRMVMSVYLGLTSQNNVNLHKRVYGNMKIIK
jgi:site-specific recombinase XerD